MALQNKALIFIDGRYTLQAHQQVDSRYFTIENIEDYWKLLKKNIETNSTIGIDPSLHSNSEIKKNRKTRKRKSLIH